MDNFTQNKLNGYYNFRTDWFVKVLTIPYHSISRPYVSANSSVVNPPDIMVKMNRRFQYYEI